MKNFFRITMAGIIALLGANLACLAQEAGEIHEVEIVGEETDS